MRFLSDNNSKIVFQQKRNQFIRNVLRPSNGATGAQAITPKMGRICEWYMLVSPGNNYYAVTGDNV